MAKIEFNFGVSHQRVENPRCPLCGIPANTYRRVNPNDVIEGQCKTCGEFGITDAAALAAKNAGAAHLIAAFIRRRSLAEPPTLREQDVAAVLASTPRYTVPEKLNLTLAQIAANTSHPGASSTFVVSHDYPLVFAENMDEATFYVRQLAELDYVKEYSAIAQLTAKGYEKLEALQRSGRESVNAFVAMWFDPKTDPVYSEAIEPAITDAGYKPIRIDRTEHVNRIDDEIVGQIRRSRFMVADFTNQRPGVYFEAGLMAGLGRNVFWMCPKEELKDVHFDVRQFNFIAYGDNKEARKRLFDRILAIEGEAQN